METTDGFDQSALVSNGGKDPLKKEIAGAAAEEHAYCASKDGGEHGGLDKEAAVNHDGSSSRNRRVDIKATTETG